MSNWANGSNGKYTTEVMIEAIQISEGNLSEAARRLECSRTTVHNYVNKYVTVRRADDEANESFLDEAESQLRRAVKKGQLPAIMFALKTKGKSRGYVERQEVQHEGGDKPIPITLIEVVKDYGNDE